MTTRGYEWLALLLGLGGLAMALYGWRRMRLGLAGGAGGEAAPSPALWRAVARPLARRLRPRGRDQARLSAALRYAGRGAREELDRFLEEKTAILLGATAGGLALGVATGGTPGLLVVLVGLALGAFLPRLRLDRARRARRDAVAAALPSAIDLLTTSVDAGLSVEQAIARVAREMARSSPLLSVELGICASECEASVPLTEALRRLAQRVDLEDLAGLCGVIAQAHELGAPIVETLCDYADSSRRLRMAALEERAGKLVTKLTLPLVLFLLPAAILAIMGPAVIQLMRIINNN
jgi:tight adherence protein C